MTRDDAIDLALMAVGLVALIARGVALFLSDLDRGLRDYRVDPVPDYIPVWVDESVDLP